MRKRRRVVLYGSSLFVAGIEAGLRASRNLEILHVDAGTAQPLEEIRQLAPDAVAFDADRVTSDLLLPLLKECPGPVLVGLDLDSNRVLVLSGRQSHILSMDQLVRVIGSIPRPVNTKRDANLARKKAKSASIRNTRLTK
jgi:hypothetical protein